MNYDLAHVNKIIDGKTLTSDIIRHLAQALEGLDLGSLSVRERSKLTVRLESFLLPFYKTYHLSDIDHKTMATLLNYAPYDGLEESIGILGEYYPIWRLTNGAILYIMGCSPGSVIESETDHKRLAETLASTISTIETRMKDVHKLELDIIRMTNGINQNLGSFNNVDSVLGEEIEKFYPYDVVRRVNSSGMIVSYVRTEFQHILDNGDPWTRQSLGEDVTSIINARMDSCKRCDLEDCMTISDTVKHYCRVRGEKVETVLSKSQGRKHPYGTSTDRVIPREVRNGRTYSRIDDTENTVVPMEHTRVSRRPLITPMSGPLHPGPPSAYYVANDGFHSGIATPVISSRQLTEEDRQTLDEFMAATTISRNIQPMGISYSALP